MKQLSSDITRLFYGHCLKPVLMFRSDNSMEFIESKSEIGTSDPKVFCNKDVLKNLPKFTGKHLSHSLFLNKSLFSFRLSATEKYLLDCFYWFRFQPPYICLSVFSSLYVSPPQKKKNWVEDCMIRSFIKTIL